MKKCISGLFILYAILLTACAGKPAVKNGEMTLERIHILSGTLSDTGVLTVIADVYDMEKKEYKEVASAW